MIQRWAFVGMYGSKAAKTPYAVCTLEGGPLFTKKASFDVRSLTWLLRPQIGSGTARGGPTEERRVRFAVAKDADALTATLFKAANDGTAIAKLELSISGGRGVLRFQDVLVEAVQPAGASPVGEPADTVTFDGILVGMDFQEGS